MKQSRKIQNVAISLASISVFYLVRTRLSESEVEAEEKTNHSACWMPRWFDLQFTFACFKGPAHSISGLVAQLIRTSQW